MISVKKLSIALTSGNTIEKTLVTAFKGTNGIYVVLDNETNGTMGLPIILISKLNNNKLELINDSNEWNSVKEYLRNIIAGNQMDYVAVDSALTADDGFFKQLTLSAEFFEKLKASYNVENESGVTATPVQNVVESAPSVVAQPEVSPMSPVEPVGPVAPQENVMPVPPVEPQPIPTPVANQNTVVTPVEQPVVEPVVPVNPVMPEAPVTQIETTFEAVTPAPIVEPIPEETPVTTMDFSVDKEAFLKACENMFDALIAKINK